MTDNDATLMSNLSTSTEYSVYQFFNTDEYEDVRRWVTLEAAMQAAVHYCTSVAARTGITTRVIITDGGDNTVFEWKFNEGITWPEHLRSPKSDAPVTPNDKLPNPFMEGHKPEEPK